MVSPVHRISKNQCREKSTASAGRLELQVLDKATYEIASHMLLGEEWNDEVSYNVDKGQWERVFKTLNPALETSYDLQQVI
jgi:hypothetical protein